jgi:hypothetical protein
MKSLADRRDGVSPTKQAIETASHRVEGCDPFCARTRTARLRRGAARAALVVALIVLAAPVLAQRHAQPRSGSSGSSSSGGRASAPATRHAPSSSSRARSGSVSSSRSSEQRASSGVAHRDGRSFSGPHRPTGHRRHDGFGRGHYPYFYYPRHSFGFSYYSPYYYSPYYAPYYYGHYGYPYYYPYAYGRRWGYQMPYGYPSEGVDGYYGREDLGAVALKVRPKTAEVYIDGRYVGTAGSFDGFPSYLWLEPGVYDLVLVHDGHANLEREVEVAPGQVLEWKLRLEPGTAERPEIDRDDRYDRGRYDRGRYDRDRYNRDSWRGERPDGDDDREDWREQDEERRARDDYDRRGEANPPPARDLPIPRDERREEARLVFDVRPDDASVYLDGRFVGTASEVSSRRGPLPVEPGEHTIEVVHPGFETQEREITVRAGDERLVEIALRRDGGL